MQVVRAAAAVRRPTPVEAVRATIVRGRAAEVAGVEEIIGETPKAATHNITSADTALVATIPAVPLGKNTIFLISTITTR